MPWSGVAPIDASIRAAQWARLGQAAGRQCRISQCVTDISRLRCGSGALGLGRGLFLRFGVGGTRPPWWGEFVRDHRIVRPITGACAISSVSHRQAPWIVTAPLTSRTTAIVAEINHQIRPFAPAALSPLGDILNRMVCQPRAAIHEIVRGRRRRTVANAAPAVEHQAPVNTDSERQAPQMDVQGGVWAARHNENTTGTSATSQRASA